MKVMAEATRHTSCNPCSLKAAYCSIRYGGTALYTIHSRLTMRLRASKTQRLNKDFQGPAGVSGTVLWAEHTRLRTRLRAGRKAQTQRHTMLRSMTWGREGMLIVQNSGPPARLVEWFEQDDSCMLQQPGSNSTTPDNCNTSGGGRCP